MLLRAGALFAAFAILSSGAAEAQQPSAAQRNAIKQNCRSDYMSYCSSVPPGGKASLQCLQKNSASLSPACQQAVAAVSGAGAKPTPAPTTAAAATPAAAAPTPAATPASAAPTPAAAAPASAAPTPAPGVASPRSAAHVSPREALRQLRYNCGYDLGRYCNDVPFGAGRILQCLAAHKDALTPECGAHAFGAATAVNLSRSSARADPHDGLATFADRVAHASRASARPFLPLAAGGLLRRSCTTPSIPGRNWSAMPARCTNSAAPRLPAAADCPIHAAKASPTCPRTRAFSGAAAAAPRRSAAPRRCDD